MNKNMIEIARSYSRTIQLEPFAPTSVFMSAKTEINDDDIETIESISEELYGLCKKTVNNDIEKLVTEKKEKEKIINELS